MTNRITIKDVYEIVEHRFDKLHIEIKEVSLQLQITNKELSKRITFLEYWKANITGKIVVGVGIISVAVPSIWSYIWKKITS